MDRYEALGVDYPDPETCCKGPCEGLGIYPVYDQWSDMGQMLPGAVVPTDPAPLTTHEILEVRRIANEQGMQMDGWYFITCPECGGSGKRAALTPMEDRP